MLKTRVLTTVSAIALATAVGATAAKADNLIIDLTVPSLTVVAASSSVEVPNAQLVLGGGDTATVANTALGFPGGDPSLLHDVAGGVVTVIVDNVNSIFAEAGSNDAVNQLDFYAATGSGTSSAATLGSLQGSTDADVIATVDNSNVVGQVLDLGAGSTVRVNDNEITADGTINAADNLVFGDINPNLTSSEIGQATIDAGAATVTAGATALAGNVQAIDGSATTQALVSDSRIGILAQTSTEPNISGSPLDLQRNTIAATFTGNEATTAVALTGNQDITLTGTAGVVNGQLADGGYTLSAEVDSVVIEAANTQDFPGDEFMADLSSSTLTVQDNQITATATANSAANSVSLDDNINLEGASSGRLNNFSAATDVANVTGDLFVASAQYSSVDVDALVDEGDINVLTGDAAGATIIADDNTQGSSATGSAVDNAIEVGNTADFAAVVAINTVQYTEGAQSASTNSLIALDTGSTEGTAESVTDSALTVDGNAIFADAMGNTHSSAIDITGTTVTGTGAQVLNPILSTRTGTAGSASADFSILNAQVLDGGEATATNTAWIDVDAGDVTFTTSSLSASGNDIHGLAIGNLSTEASIAIDATTLDGTLALVSAQTVEDSALLSSTITPLSTAFIEVDVASGNAGVDAATVTEAAVNVDDNTFNSRVWGNLADSTTNSIDVSGVTVTGDGGVLQASFSVSRTGDVPNTAVDHTIALLNDQSVEDLNGSTVVAAATGDLINVTVGNDNPATEVTNSNVTASGNAATTSATLNQGTSEISVDAVSLDSGAGLVNVQTVADEDGTDGAATIDVDQADLDIHIDVVAGDVAIENLTAQANDNSTLASARLNQASNSVSVTSQTQTLSDTLDSVGPNGTTSAFLTDTLVSGHGESLLANDQSFAPLGTAGVNVQVLDNEIDVGIGLDGNDLLNSVVEANGNSVTALAAGNDAANNLALDVGSFDLSGADYNGGGGSLAANGGIATVLSNQTGADGDTGGGFTTLVGGTLIGVEADNTGTNTIDGSNLSADENTVRALSRSNNVTNVLTATGTTVLNDADLDPLTTIDTAAGNVAVDQTSLTVASRQVSSVDMSSTVGGTTIGVDAGVVLADPLTGDVTGSSLSADGNLIVAEARGNDAGNSLISDFVENAASATVANSQVAGDAAGLGDPLTYEATVDTAIIGVTTDVDGVVSDSAYSTSGNAIAALSSANRATNTMNAGGTNVVMRNGDATTTIDPGAGSLTSDASLSVLNLQGAPSLTADPVIVNATVDTAAIAAVAAGDVDSGSVTADTNLILAQAVEHSATNTLNITASANIDSLGVADETPGASVASFQTITDGSEVNAVVTTVGILALADDTRTAGSVAASASDNQVLASAIGGTATNRLQAVAGAEINNGQGSSPLVGDGATTDHVTDAGFNVLNVQQGTAAVFDSDISVVGIAAGGLEDYLNDSVVVDNNIVQGEARGFVATNVAVLDAGSSSTASAAVVNVQSLTDSTSESTIGGVVILTGNVDEGAEFSSLTVTDNAVQALSSGNLAINALSTTAAASLQESSGTGSAIDITAANPITVTGADYAILNAQSNTGGTINSAIDTVGIGIDGLEETTGVNNSALNVEGNRVLASAVGSDATNSLVLNTGTFAHPSAAVANLQVNAGTGVTASVDAVAIGIGGVGTTLSATSTNSTFSVRGNSIGASAIGNSAVNSLTSGN